MNATQGQVSEGEAGVMPASTDLDTLEVLLSENLTRLEAIEVLATKCGLSSEAQAELAGIEQQLYKINLFGTCAQDEPVLLEAERKLTALHEQLSVSSEPETEDSAWLDPEALPSVQLGVPHMPLG